DAGVADVHLDESKDPVEQLNAPGTRDEVGPPDPRDLVLRVHASVVGGPQRHRGAARVAAPEAGDLRVLALKADRLLFTQQRGARLFEQRSSCSDDEGRVAPFAQFTFGDQLSEK